MKYFFAANCLFFKYYNSKSCHSLLIFVLILYIISWPLFFISPRIVITLPTIMTERLLLLYMAIIGRAIFTEKGIKKRSKMKKQ